MSECSTFAIRPPQIRPARRGTLAVPQDACPTAATSGFGPLVGVIHKIFCSGVSPAVIYWPNKHCQLLTFNFYS